MTKHPHLDIPTLEQRLTVMRGIVHAVASARHARSIPDYSEVIDRYLDVNAGLVSDPAVWPADLLKRHCDAAARFAAFEQPSRLIDPNRPVRQFERPAYNPDEMVLAGRIWQANNEGQGLTVNDLWKHAYLPSPPQVLALTQRQPWELCRAVNGSPELKDAPRIQDMERAWYLRQVAVHSELQRQRQLAQEAEREGAGTAPRARAETSPAVRRAAQLAVRHHATRHATSPLAPSPRSSSLDTARETGPGRPPAAGTDRGTHFGL
jgi:hypothetical protein